MREILHVIGIHRTKQWTKYYMSEIGENIQCVRYYM